MENRELTQLQKIERSIHKRFRRELWRLFIAGIQKYELIQPNDKIAVCISGGKDSMLMAKLFQQLHRHSDIAFEPVYMVMNPGYNHENLQKIISNAALLQIPITIFESDIFKIVSEADGSPCYLCARMRRGYLYAHAQRLGCNKIALGHHMNDVVETTLMGMLYAAQYQVMMPKLKSRNFAGMELIRPMYCIDEASILAWKNYNGLSFMQCGCPLTEASDNRNKASTRQTVKDMLAQLKQQHKDVEKSVFQSLQMVNLETTIGYKLNGREYSFLDSY
ncbi:MAG: tRNA 2-thiocytidine biosynthesis protein TtcA [Defluviitaleaceae bacterium]|nr:tRNA 2-thiocytidine biosynthesis protein TtcA [Defluviitaleaceae bacterium]